ncbi:putative ATP-grasp enzyme [Salinisphaera sp. T31B1]
MTPAVVVGGGINGLGVVRSLGQAGVPTIVIDANAAAPALRSRYAKAVISGGDQPSDIVHALESVAGRLSPLRPVLILTTEQAVAAVASNYGSMSKRFHLTMGAPSRLEPALHKDGVRTIALEAGLAIPRTIHITEREQLDAIARCKLPLVVKPGRRTPAYEQAFDKAYRVDDYDSARHLIARILPVLPDVIVQEWVVGLDSDLYFCLQYRPLNGGRAFSFVGRKLVCWPPRVGGTASCTAAPEAGELVEATDRFFEHAGIRGLASMEYKYDMTRNAYVIVEPTVGRTDFQEEIATLCGTNLPLLAYCDTLDLAAPARLPPGTRVRVWRERYGTARSAAHPHAEPAVMPEGAQVVDALQRWNDPGPAVASLVARVERRLPRIGRRKS